MPEVSLPPLPEPESTRIFLVNHKGGVQSQVRAGQIGITRTHPDYFTSRVVSSYFGGAFNSRLNETIRVAKGLTYGARGGYSAQKLAGEFQVSTFTKTASTAEAVQAVLGEIERLRSEPPTGKELQQTKSYTLGSFARERETPQQVAGDLWLIQSHGLPEDYIQRLLDGVAQTEEADCTRLVQNSLDPEKLVIAVVGDAEQLKEDLEKIAPVTVVEGSS
jgi:zinc protease